jgi:hypothetical protein
MGMAVTLGLPAMLAAQTATFTTFGTGCRGPAGTPKMAAVTNSRPIIGKRFQVLLTSLPGAVYNTAIGVVGISRTRWKAASLPMDLTHMGITSCNMYVSPEHMEPVLNRGGTATWNMDIPNNASIVGSTAYLQAWVIDGHANPGAVLVTNAGEAKLGSR